MIRPTLTEFSSALLRLGVAAFFCPSQHHCKAFGDASTISQRCAAITCDCNSRSAHYLSFSLSLQSRSVKDS
ncbi:hypothetical protein VTN31DRAFT_5904 [Thermomyces dupontii]|uniref:uncharacterized protein n=1 Tax=Talaromyces thermophilus TaxID=28565 RepID=UPI0037439714